MASGGPRIDTINASTVTEEPVVAPEENASTSQPDQNAAHYVLCVCGHDACLEQTMPGIPADATRVVVLNNRTTALKTQNTYEIINEPIYYPILISTDSGKSRLCNTCDSLAIWKLEERGAETQHHGSLEALYVSAKSCDFCFMISNIPSLQTPIRYDTSRPIRLRSTLVRSSDTATKAGIESLEIIIPTIETGREALICTRSSKLGVVASLHSQAALLGVVQQRPIYGAMNIGQIHSWLSDCLHKHEVCVRADRRAQVNRYGDGWLAPKRLIDVDPGSTTGRSRLVLMGDDRQVQYLTLSYQWGQQQSDTTTKSSNYSEYLNRIDESKLCRIFQDAIEMTRRLGFQYLWIDALCIIQDDWEDKVSQISNMADIYENSAITLSASISTSSESRLINPPVRANNIELQYCTKNGIPLGTISITDRVLIHFKDEVENGALSGRAWCLQERLLARRLIHFGKDQIYWECLAGIREEASCIEKKHEGHGIGKLRERFYEQASGASASEDGCKSEQPRTFPEIEGIPLRQDPNLEQIFSRKPFGDWYKFVSVYSGRHMKSESDKLPAIAGVSRRFARRLDGDVYLAGLWKNDLRAGLLWEAVTSHRGGSTWALHALWRPEEPRAPSWTWSSVDGPISYPLGNIKFFYITVLDAVVRPKSFDIYSEVHAEGRLRIEGLRIALREVWGFRRGDEEPLQRLRNKFKHMWPTCVPSCRFDCGEYPEIWNNCQADNIGSDIYAVFAAVIGCGATACNHFAGCDRLLGYALLCRKLEDGSYSRIGLATVWFEQFLNGRNCEREIMDFV